jgi:rhodanese-related sulfurtransferase
MQVKGIKSFMIFTGFRFAIVFVGLAVLLSFTSLSSIRASTLSSPQAASDGVPRVTPDEVRELLKQGKAVLVDVRGTPVYKAGHVKGALDIALADIAQRAAELPKNKIILTYCSWPAEHTSARAVQLLKEKGIENAAAVKGGYDALVKAGFATETSNWLVDKALFDQVTNYILL